MNTSICLRLIGVVVVFLSTTHTSSSQTSSYFDTAPPFRGPQTYKDAESGTTFYVESDGRHVSAIDKEGKILWNRNPFVDGKLQPYRFKIPVIVFIGEPSKWQIEDRKGRYIAISFNSSQFGIIDMANGDFIWMGQD